jgi:hypothetical protein
MISASPEESVGSFWLWKVAKLMISRGRDGFGVFNGVQLIKEWIQQIAVRPLTV